MGVMVASCSLSFLFLFRVPLKPTTPLSQVMRGLTECLYESGNAAEVFSESMLHKHQPHTRHLASVEVP